MSLKCENNCGNDPELQIDLQGKDADGKPVGEPRKVLLCAQCAKLDLTELLLATAGAGTDDGSLHSTDGSQCVCNPRIARHGDVLHYIHNDLSKTESQQ